MMETKKGLSSAFLHIFAMGAMLLDHLWGTIVSGNDWMTCLGRLAFPIYAFMIAEGWRHTRDKKAYAMRLLILACISEIPFNLMVAGSFIYPFSQNVIWTFLIAIAAMAWMDRTKQRHADTPWKVALVTAFAILAGYGAGFLFFTNYFGVGVLTVLVFYLLPKRTPWHMALQFVLLYILHAKMLGGMSYIVQLGSFEFALHRQSLALCALIPIWLYRGTQGYHATWFRLFCYGFYPGHMLILYLIAMCM